MLPASVARAAIIPSKSSYALRPDMQTDRDKHKPQPQGWGFTH
jgi:hypothetical protein